MLETGRGVLLGSHLALQFGAEARTPRLQLQETHNTKLPSQIMGL